MVKRNTQRYAVILVAIALVGIPATTLADPLAPLTAVTTAEGVAISEGDRPVLFYQRAPKSLAGRYERAGYVHPLHDLDGEILTEDFPPDHLHQRGIYWAWHQVWVGDQRIGDPWAIQDFSWVVESIQVADSDEPDSLSLVAHVLWQSPLWRDEQGGPRPLVHETSRIRVHRATGDMRKIDFQIELLARHPGVRLGGSEDEKGYGGFSARIRLPEGVQFIGRDGNIEPRIEAVAAGPWVDISARFSERGTSGMTILCHPSTPGFPQPWVLRSSLSMQNPAWPGREPVALPTDEPLVLRYRIVLHRGTPTRDAIDAWQGEYSRGVN